MDLRKRIVRIYYHNKRNKKYLRNRNINSVSRRLLVSPGAVRKYVNLFNTTGRYKTLNEVNNVTHGRNANYDNIDLLVLKCLIKKDPTLYLDEIRMKLIERRRKYVSVSGIVRMLRKCNITRKRLGKKGHHWQYRSVAICFNNVRSLRITKTQFAFADESHYNDRVANRTYGRSIEYVKSHIFSTPFFSMRFFHCSCFVHSHIFCSLTYH